MSKVTATVSGFTVNAWQGDAKTLLAFNLPKKKAVNLAGFTIQYKVKDQPPRYLQNNLQFEFPGKHAQVGTEPTTSSVNAPIHKFRWLHVPGSFHQGLKPFMGPYTYTVTPRYFDDHRSLLPLDSNLSTTVTVAVQPFRKGNLSLGFTRGFTQSQAFVHHFGLKTNFRPKAPGLIFDTTAIAGKNDKNENYTFQQQYEWLGFTARERVFAILDEVLADKSLSLAVFAYDLNEPDFAAALIKLGAQGRVRVILDNAALHHDEDKPKPEDEFERLFNASAKNPAKVLRGKFGRYAHDKVLIVSDKNGPTIVLTGSTNFSVTGLYVNSNHVLVFNDAKVAAKYLEVFDFAFTNQVAKAVFAKSPLADQAFSFSTAKVPQTDITFSPHSEAFAKGLLDDMVARINEEQATTGGSVMFAVMEIGTGSGPIFPALVALHKTEKIYSYGITDTTDGIELYKPGRKTGILVTGKPARTRLPKPFDQVPSVGLGHQIHHKFVICGFNGKKPVVYCGSSNLALMGEQVNGDNLLAIHDEDVATAFALEALGLVDHFDFLDRSSATKSDSPTPSLQDLAAEAKWYLSTSDAWTKPYFDSGDLHCVDRELFG